MTQMHGLGLSKVWRWLFVAVFIIALITTYSEKGWSQAHEILRIPAIDYLLILILAVLIKALINFQKTHSVTSRHK